MTILSMDEFGIWLIVLYFFTVFKGIFGLWIAFSGRELIVKRVRELVLKGGGGWGGTMVSKVSYWGESVKFVCSFRVLDIVRFMVIIFEFFPLVSSLMVIFLRFWVTETILLG